MASTSQIESNVLLHGPSVHPHQLSWPTIVLISIAGFKTVAGLLIVTPFAPPVSGQSDIGLQAVVRGVPWLIPAIVLLLVHGRQFRTASLGVAMLLFATRSTSGAFEQLARSIPVLALLLDVAPQVFMPYYFGKFLLEFPQPRTGPSARWLKAATRLSALFGVVQFVAVLLRTVTAGWHRPFVYRLLLGAVDTRVSPMANYSLCLVVLALSFVGFGGLLPEDRLRHRRLFIGWVMLIAPFSVWVVEVALAGPNRAIPSLPLWLRSLNGILVLTGLVAPSVLAYRVIEGRAWQVRGAVLRAGRVMFDFRLLLFMATAPIVVITGIAYRHQDQRVSDVFSRAAIAWMIVAGASGALLLSRRRLVRGFNRWFFSEHYDAGETLFGLTGRMRQSRSIDELVAHLASGIDRALRPYRVVVLVLNETATEFVPLFGAAEPLPPSTLLAELLAAGQGGVLDTQLAGGTSPMRWLPQEERYWLVDCGAQLIVPLRASDGTLNGLITLSDRRSGQPYSDDDRKWLTALAESATLTIEAHSTSTAAGTAPGASVNMWRVGLVQRHERALECSRCGGVDDAGTTVCRECGAALAPSMVPRLLVGKFRFERRIGRGAMGVVYRAMDLDLERPVAVKMLPGATPEYSELLRLEARAMAAVTHRHLAVVYGVEAWRGQPLLICEYMEHGTLSDRLSHGPMAPDEVLALGAGLAEALVVIHARNMLHRDIKPSNIGFDHTGMPKLLDFGLARLLSTATLPEELRPDIRTAGTPLYMSPEAVAGLPPAHSFDLWSLHVLLYEAIAGQHPFRRDTTEATLRAITHDTPAPLAAVTGLSADRAARVTSYFTNALVKDAAGRPQSAADAATALRALMT